ncbi:MAG: hypothetical protein WBB82_04370 [Limnothrix sp.]
MTSSAYQSDIQISGDVRIDPHAVIAPGVIIQAAPNSYVAIASGACIGMGSILQAHEGSIEIGKGATLGAGTLIIGGVEVGENACVGYGTTVFRAAIAAGQILPPNSLVGDASRPAPSNQHNNKNSFSPPPKHQNTFSTPKTKPKPPPQKSSDFDPWDASLASSPPIPPPHTYTDPTSRETQPTVTEKSPQEIIPAVILSDTEIFNPEVQKTEKAPVVGQVYISQLLMTLFPQNNQIKPPNSAP